jgi:hypothetical protein
MVGALVGLTPIVGPAALAIGVVGGIGGAMLGSKLGGMAGGVVKKGLEGAGRIGISGAKKVFGWFH